MAKNTKYLQVNWVDGMKISREHFTTLEHSVSTRINDARQISTDLFSYGLLPVTGLGRQPARLSLFMDNQQTLHARVFECSAVLLGGGRIDIQEADTAFGFDLPVPEVAFDPAQAKQEELLVTISVDHFDLTPVGPVNPAEDPPRFPYAMPQYKVNILPVSQVNKKEIGFSLLVAGKIRITENGPDLVKDYIPPCTSVLSHPKLISYHYQFDKFFNQLEVDVATILKKIHDKEQSNPLALTVKYISEPLLYFLSTTIQGFGWQVPVQPPVYMIGHIASCARVLRNAIDSCSGKAREELLNYFVEWCNIKQGEFEKMLLRTINFQYEHVEIQKSIDTMVYFSDVVSQLFSKLSSLEYIGKKKETSIFVKEQPTAKKSFLAD